MSMEISEKLQGILATLPAKPGCYLMKNAAGTIIYVGKAISLKNRVRSYFHADASHDGKTRRLVREIADIEWILVGSELEALILEMNLIKKHRPKYNVRLKDDKRYPYIKIHWADPFPKVTVTRQMAEDGSRYFGPYTSAWAVYQTLDALRRIFPYLTCDRIITGQDKRACLYYDIKLCTAPCIGAVHQAGYRQMISDLMAFLSGHSEDIVARLQSAMDKAAEEMRFEKAAALRDQLKAVQSIIERQKIVFASDYLDSDVLAMARADGEACVQIFFIRGGKLIGREYFILEGTEDADNTEVMSQFVKQFYTAGRHHPAAGDAAGGDRRGPHHRPVAAHPTRRREGGVLRPEGGPASPACSNGRRECLRDALRLAHAMAGRHAQTGAGPGRAAIGVPTARPAQPHRML